MNYILDTNIVLHCLAGKTSVKKILKSHKVLKKDSGYISIVSVGELLSIVYQRKWGAKRINELEKLLDNFIIIPLEQRDIIERYAEIDAFSQGKLESKSLKTSSRNMGKNDIWIAATASITDATLITADNDFDHLDQEYINLLSVKA